MYKTTTTPFRKSCTNRVISHRLVVAYNKHIKEAFFYPSIYIYACGSLRIFNALVAVRELIINSEFPKSNLILMSISCLSAKFESIILMLFHQLSSVSYLYNLTNSHFSLGPIYYHFSLG